MQACGVLPQQCLRGHKVCARELLLLPIVLTAHNYFNINPAKSKAI